MSQNQQQPTKEETIMTQEVKQVGEEVYQHAYEYAQLAVKQGYQQTTPEEESYYQEHVRHVEQLEDAYARGFFDGREAATLSR